MRSFSCASICASRAWTQKVKSAKACKRSLQWFARSTQPHKSLQQFSVSTKITTACELWITARLYWFLTFTIADHSLIKYVGLYDLVLQAQRAGLVKELWRWKRLPTMIFSFRAQRALIWVLCCECKCWKSSVLQSKALHRWAISTR